MMHWLTTSASMDVSPCIACVIPVASGFVFPIRPRTYRGRSQALASPTSEENGLHHEHPVFKWNDNDEPDVNGHRFNAHRFASSNCWGRRPFLMRGAFDPNLLLDNCDDDIDGEEEAKPWPSWEEVVEIAADDDAESRVISHVPGDHASFELQWGPLDEGGVDAWLSKSSNTNIFDRKETLVVNDIDRFYPPAADWMHDAFSFLPKWRMDDGQISLAEKGGGIGPHVDNYDVFLIQMSGTRTWQVGKNTISAQEEQDRSIDGLDVRVLSDWGVDDEDGPEMEEFTIHAGDLLYLPPRFAHCGVALSNDSMTLSVGCRAPSVSDLVSKLAEKLSSSIDDDALRRYTDEDLFIAQKIEDLVNMPGELTLEAKQRAKDLVLDSLTAIIRDDDWWDEFFGRYVTEQKRVRNNYPIPLDDWVDESSDDEDNVSDDWKDAKSIVQSALAGKGVLYHAEGIAFAHSHVQSNVIAGRTSHRFYVNGEMWQSISQSNDSIKSSLPSLFQTVSNNRMLDSKILVDEKGDLSSDEKGFLEELVSAGVLYGSEE